MERGIGAVAGHVGCALRSLLAALAALAVTSPAAQAVVDVQPSAAMRETWELRVEWDGRRFALWPHEGVAADRFERVPRDAVESIARGPDGALRWRLADLAARDLRIEVEARPEEHALELRYALHNDAEHARLVSIAPCFQLAPGITGPPRERDEPEPGGEGWSRAKHVLLPTAEHGWRWIADTEQRRGVRSGDADPDPDRAPWTQHFAAPGVSARELASNRGLALFGVASERAAAGFLAAASDDGVWVAVATEDSLGVTYAFLDCLHVTPYASVPPRGEASLRVRIAFHRGDLASLRARVLGELPRLVLPPVQADLPQTPGRALPLGAGDSVALPAIDARGALLAADVVPAAPGRAPIPVELSVLSEAGAVRAAEVIARGETRVAPGRPRRVLVPITGPRPAGRVRLRLRALDGRGGALRLAHPALYPRAPAAPVPPSSVW
ncbi:MAG: hypothetical protein DCC71_02560 [Proteobacteria bacterium]|nr:MAG: hypothetical protein DCC71_02560 [Pseudomonadota bacterium]